jgi:CheY-like chemotaxis protein
MPILLVENDAEIRFVISELLADEGYTVVQAADGGQALSYLQNAQELPCVIILDLMMPLMNGWDFLQVRQHDPVLAPIPIVVVSAARGHATAAALGVQERLAKPIDLDSLLATVQRYCPSASSQDGIHGR